jgi:protein SCO1
MSLPDDTPATRPASSPSGPAIVVGLAIALAAVLILGVLVRALRDEAPVSADDFNGTLLEEPRTRPDFTLADTDGEPFDFVERTEGRLTILFFGYANCPDVCPITLATLDEALGAAPGINADVVFVSVDPERDTPEALRDYLDRFDRRFVGLTGTPEQLAAAQQAAGVSVAYNDGPNDRGGYDVGHSSQVIVFTPDGQGRLVYGFGVRRDEWADDLERIRDNAAWWP